MIRNINEKKETEAIEILMKNVNKLVETKRNDPKVHLLTQNLYESLKILHDLLIETRKFDKILTKRYKHYDKLRLENDSFLNEISYQQASVKFHLSIYSTLSIFNQIIVNIEVPPFLGKPKYHKSVEKSLTIWDEVAIDDIDFLIQTDLLKASYIFRTYIDHPQQFPVMNWLTTHSKNTLIIYYVPIYSDKPSSTSFNQLMRFKFKKWNKIYEDEGLNIIMRSVTQSDYLVVPPCEVTFEAVLFYINNISLYFVNYLSK